MEALFFFNSAKAIALTNISATDEARQKVLPAPPGSFQNPTNKLNWKRSYRQRSKNIIRAIVNGVSLKAPGSNRRSAKERVKRTGSGCP